MKMHEPFGGQCRLENSFNAGKASTGVEAAPWRGRNLRISLKQWKMFHAVLDHDGFFGAADSLHVTQSTVSQGVAKLQEQLGVTLLELKGRKAHITEEGRLLLERSRDLVRNAVELEELADMLRQGIGPEIRVMVDPSFPVDLLMRALEGARSLSPSARLNVSEATAELARQALRHNTVEFVIGTQAEFGFVSKHLIEIEHVLIAHPDNSLFSLKRDISADELHTQFQIVVCGALEQLSPDTSSRSRQFQQPWRVGSLDRAFDVLRHGVGFAWLPRHQVQKWLDEHQARIVPLANGSMHRTPLYLSHGRALPSEVGSSFVDALRCCCAQFSRSLEHGKHQDH